MVKAAARHKQDLAHIFAGLNNADIERSRGRLIRGGTYRDVSTLCLIPCRGLIAPRVVQSWMGMISPMNQKFFRIFLEDMEVGEAYSKGIETVLAHPELSKWKYILTLESDNCPPPDGLLKLYESMERYDAVGGLYWVKGENGQPMCYGDPKVMPKNFIPQVPAPNTVTECNGLGMGFTLFKMEMFKKIKERPFFRTVQEYVPGQGARMGTQDLQFFEVAGRYGFRCACDSRVLVGHWDESTKTMW